MIRPLLFFIAVALSQTAQAEGRIRLVRYDPNQVVDMPVAHGFAAIVELGKDETAENVVVGNSADWQVVPDSSGQRVIVKPLGDASTTNLIIVTETHRYTFLLSASDGDGRDVFVVHFSYPPQGPSNAFESAPQATYKLRGSKSLFPVEMHDDGKYTTITWNNQTVLPAVFAVEGRSEGIVNGRMVGPNYVIEGVASKFVLRLGSAEATAIRQSFRASR